MESLTISEMQVANEYCKGLSDKEVANNLEKSIWTVKVQKKSIYRKVGISKDTELLLYMLCLKLKRNFDLKEIRKHGLEILLSLLFIVMQCMSIDYGVRRGEIEIAARNCRIARRSNYYYL